MGRVANKTVVVTGAAKGIGFACCKVLAKEGAKIVLADIDEEIGQRAAEEIQRSGSDALFVHHDVTSESHWEELIK